MKHARVKTVLQKNRLGMILILCVGLPLCLFLSWVLLQQENNKEMGDYNQRSQQMMTAINQKFQNDTELLFSLRSFIAAVDDPTFDIFSRFVTPYLVLRPEIEAITWARVVADGQRDVFEARARKQFPAYTLRGGRSGHLVYPVYFQQPEDPSLLGVDLGLSPMVLDVLSRACDTNQMVALDTTISNVFWRGSGSDPSQRSRIELFFPLYKEGTSFNDPGQWKDNQSGLVILRVNLRTLVETSRGGDMTQNNLHVEIVEDPALASLTESRIESLDSSHHLPVVVRELDRLLNLHLDTTYQVHFPLNVGTLTKIVTFTFTNDTHWFMKHKLVFFALFAGLIMVALMGVYLSNLLLLVKAKTDVEVANKARIESEGKLRSIFNVMTEGILMLYEDGHVRAANAGVEKILGIPRDRIMNAALVDLPWRTVHENGAPYSSASHPVLISLQTGASIHNDVMGITRADGSIIWALVNSEPLYRPGGKSPFAAIATFNDITAYKHAEDQVRLLNADLEKRVNERTADLESFSYSVSHNLRTPLRAIDGYARILLEEHREQLDDEGRRLLKVVHANTIRMAMLIDDILSFSRLGRKDMATQGVNMAMLAEVTMEELKPAMDDGRTITWDMGDLPPARGDSAMLRQVWVNLFSNAIKFTRIRNAAVITVGGCVEGNELVYHVKDNGVGFDMQFAEKLFGVFQRLHGHEEFEGTGIGLAIVKRIVTRHGGRVWAESNPGEGAAIYFTLPVRENTGYG